MSFPTSGRQKTGFGEIRTVVLWPDGGEGEITRRLEDRSTRAVSVTNLAKVQ